MTDRNEDKSISKYDELRAAYIEFEDAELKYLRECQILAANIAKNLKEELSIPVEFIAHDQVIPYISFHRLSRDEGEVEPERESVFNAVDCKRSGEFSFAIGVLVERDKKSFPKKRLTIPFRCQRVGAEVEMTIADTDPFRVPMTGEETSRVTAVIFQLLMENLSLRPGNTDKVRNVGFATVTDKSI